MEPLPTPSPTSVRITGDHYQWLIAWEGCLALLRENAARSENPVASVGVELDGAGNLDDVVLLRRTPPHTYTQVKYTVDSSTPVNEEYLTKPSKNGGPSVLKKIAKAWQKLTADGVLADLALFTNRAPDPADPLVAVRDFPQSASHAEGRSPGGPISARYRPCSVGRGSWSERGGTPRASFRPALRPRSGPDPCPRTPAAAHGRGWPAPRS